MIIGMDWLAKFKGVIECARRAVTLVNGGVKVEFMVGTLSVEESKLDHMEGSTVDQIRIVCEFPDIFLDKLPGMPLD